MTASRRTHHTLCGFTLIELLVVIGIVAALAALLFPVIVEARSNARTTMCLSNQKQVVAAFVMYSQDYDDTLTPYANGILNSVTVTRQCTIGSWEGIKYWPQLVQSYLRYWQIVVCPENALSSDSDHLRALGFAEGTTGLMLEHANACFPDFGYNQQYLSPLNATETMFVGTSLAGIAQPAATILGADSSRSSPYSNTAVGINYVDGPSKIDWVVTGENRWYGNAAPRHHGLANVAFADGHVKAKTISSLMDGYEAATTTIINTDAYLWDLR